ERHRLAGKANDGRLDGLLHRPADALPLPADEGTTVIFDRELIAGHATSTPKRGNARAPSPLVAGRSHLSKRGRKRGPRRRSKTRPQTLPHPERGRIGGGR